MTNKKELRERLEAFKKASRELVGNIKDVPAWQVLYGSAIGHKYTGDIDCAINDMVKCISLTRTKKDLMETTATNLNYLADLYLINDASDQAETALQESIELSRFRFPLLLADNLWILAGIQNRKGRYEEALASAQESLRVCEDQGHSHGVLQAQRLIETIETNVGTQ